MTPAQGIIYVFVIFCRVSSFLIIAPGFSGDRIPVLLRLYLSLAISILTAPVVESTVSIGPSLNSYSIIAQLIVHELLVGIFYGFLCRMFIFAVESIITSFCYTIGLSNIFDSGVTDSETSPVLTSFILIMTLQLVFIAELDMDLVQGINNSFSVIPIDTEFHFPVIINDLVNAISQTYLIVLRISSPLLIFAIIVNLIFAFLARLSPHMPVYFISGPCVILIGVIYLNFISTEFFVSLVFSIRNYILRD